MSKTPVSLSGKVVAVTGGARGIGEATGRALRAAGAEVVVGDLDLDLAQQSASSYDASALALDVTSRESVEAFLDGVVERHGRLDAMVNNAGIMVLGEFREVPLERQLAQVRINLEGVILGSHAAAERMDNGVIVNIASLAGRIPMPGSAVYSAVKAGVIAFSEALDAELSPRVRVGAVLPSFTATELIAGTRATGMTAPISPEQVADAVVAMVDRPKLTTTVPGHFALSGAQWPLLPRRTRPWMRRRFGLDTVFTQFDRAGRAGYDQRTGG